MKLATVYNKTNVLITLSVLFVGAIIYYFAIDHITDKQIDGDLRGETKETIDFIRDHQHLPSPNELEGQQTFFTKTKYTSTKICYYDTLYTEDGKTESGRAEVSDLIFKGQHYKTTIIVSRQNTETFVKLITSITFALVISLLLALFLINRYVLNGLWQPFYRTLSDIKAFNIADESTVSQQLIPNKIDEFNELHEAVRQMSERVKNEFVYLKHFTENASHEMRTPLAVITAKLDMLIQDETLQQEQLEQLTDIYSATNKLTKLNQTLVLLVKIENRLIQGEELIIIKELVINKVKQFQELIGGKHITTALELADKELLVSKYLFDVLLNNLLSNAIRHNESNGRLNITLTQQDLTFQNTGKNVALHGDAIFKRFNKDQSSDGTGLGLAIVKNICQLYGWQIVYEFKDHMHNFKISF